jgi:RNA polymerase sigma factor (sigma-70 family)
VEASTIPAQASLATPVSTARISAGPLLRLRSDEQLVRLFRAGSEEAFRVIHDRYRTRLFAYARQMLGGSRADAEDALQDVFVRAYGALRANDRDVSLRAWLYRIAHNRCVDELRRVSGTGFVATPSEVLELVQAPSADPMDAVQRRESLRRLVEDVRRLPEQQRSALLMREISGMAYQDLAAALDVTVPAVKSLLVRARIGLAQSAEARDTACTAIRADLADAHERGVRASGLSRRHLRDCNGCSAYRRELRVLDARLTALVPALGPAALAAKLLGAVLGGGGSGVAGGGASAAGGATVVGTGAGAGAIATGFGAGSVGIGASHIVAAVAVAVVSAGSAVEVQHSLMPHHRHPAAVHRGVAAYGGYASSGASAPRSGDAGGLARQTAAARQRDAALRLRLRIAPATAGDTLDPLVPTLEPSAAGPANGGAGAPVEPATQPADPAAPPPDTSPPAGSDGTVVGTTSGSSSAPPPPPAPGDATTPVAPSADDSGPAAPPSTSAAPSGGSAATTPPSSASVGGAAYPSNR